MNVEHDTNRRPEEEAHEVLEVVLSDAVVNPWTVVVEFRYASIAFVAMFRPQWFPDYT